MTKKNPNMTLWDEVCTTDPAMTKSANVRGNKITAIAPQSQVKQATEQFGSYGSKWGFKTVDIDYTLMEKGLVVFKGLFYYPAGEFEIISSIGIYKDNAKTKIDDDFAKKVETDALTKALSKIGFNADIFLGMYDDNRYVTALWEEKKAAQGDTPEKTAESETPKFTRNKEKWAGPLNLTDLKTRARAFYPALEQVNTEEDMVALAEEFKPMTDQLRVDLRSWWKGDKDQEGMAAAIQEKHNSIKERKTA